jgi:hypothetical protein
MYAVLGATWCGLWILAIPHNGCIENVVLFGKSKPDIHSKVLLFLLERWQWEYCVQHFASLL